MSWTCPACQNAIRHSDVETAPRSGVIYRCHVCRLELIVDQDRETMALAPFPGGEVDPSNLKAPAPIDKAVRAVGRGRRR